jgi:hypothetical protein
MKTIFALCGVIAVAGAVMLARHLKTPMLYGSFTGAQKIAVAELIADPKGHLHKLWAVEDVIRDQCTSMGCYFTFYAGDKSLRVELAEIAMHAPKRRDGRPALVEGQLMPYGTGYQLVATAVEFK